MASDDPLLPTLLTVAEKSAVATVAKYKKEMEEMLDTLRTSYADDKDSTDNIITLTAEYHTVRDRAVQYEQDMKKFAEMAKQTYVPGFEEAQQSGGTAKMAKRMLDDMSAHFEQVLESFRHVAEGNAATEKSIKRPSQASKTTDEDSDCAGKERLEHPEPVPQTAGQAMTACETSETAGQASETAGQASETAGQALETAGQASETADQATETAGQASGIAGQFLETAGQFLESAGQFMFPARQASETTGEASKSAGGAPETDGQASEPSGEEDCLETPGPDAEASETVGKASKTGGLHLKKRLRQGKDLLLQGASAISLSLPAAVGFPTSAGAATAAGATAAGATVLAVATGVVETGVTASVVLGPATVLAGAGAVIGVGAVAYQAYHRMPARQENVTAGFFERFEAEMETVKATVSKHEGDLLTIQASLKAIVADRLLRLADIDDDSKLAQLIAAHRRGDGKLAQPVDESLNSDGEWVKP